MFERYEAALSGVSDRRSGRGSFEALPTFIKDMVPVAGLPSTWGAAALAGAPPQKRTRGVARDIQEMGMVLLGTSTMPEWGFVPSTEFPQRPPTRNPWNAAAHHRRLLRWRRRAGRVRGCAGGARGRRRRVHPDPRGVRGPGRPQAQPRAPETPRRREEPAVVDLGRRRGVAHLARHRPVLRRDGAGVPATVDGPPWER
ncbi:MAG: amidase family protein [Microthrixaceae bacterium]|nr:amidase family protein [Microthrixaceae bacterium]